EHVPLAEDSAPGRAILLALAAPGAVVRCAALDPALGRAAPLVVASAHDLEPRAAIGGGDARRGDGGEQGQVERVVLAVIAERIGLDDLHLAAEAAEARCDALERGRHLGVDRYPVERRQHRDPKA